jgi:hypothetical protein
MGAKRRVDMRIAFLLGLLTMIGVASPRYENSVFDITSNELVGTWYGVALIPADIPGTLKADTTWYEIRELTQTQRDELLWATEQDYIKKPLTFDVVYPRGGRDLAYIYTPGNPRYDSETEMSSVTYKMIRDYSRNKVRGEISFEMPDIDMLWVITGNRIITLRKAR